MATQMPEKCGRWTQVIVGGKNSCKVPLRIIVMGMIISPHSLEIEILLSVSTRLYRPMCFHTTKVQISKYQDTCIFQALILRDRCY